MLCGSLKRKKKLKRDAKCCCCKTFFRNSALGLEAVLPNIFARLCTFADLRMLPFVLWLYVLSWFWENWARVCVWGEWLFLQWKRKWNCLLNAAAGRVTSKGSLPTWFWQWEWDCSWKIWLSPGMKICWLVVCIWLQVCGLYSTWLLCPHHRIR